MSPMCRGYKALCKAQRFFDRCLFCSLVFKKVFLDGACIYCMGEILKYVTGRNKLEV